jgi:hypothetical protein
MFVQLTKEDCSYLLELIQEMDSDTLYTARQRAYTVPKLKKIQNDPSSAGLKRQDTEYLLDLIDDDDAPEVEFQRGLTLTTLLNIQQLQKQKAEEARGIEDQREARRARRIQK